MMYLGCHSETRSKESKLVRTLAKRVRKWTTHPLSNIFSFTVTVADSILRVSENLLRIRTACPIPRNGLRNGRSEQELGRRSSSTCTPKVDKVARRTNVRLEGGQLQVEVKSPCSVDDNIDVAEQLFRKLVSFCKLGGPR